MLGLVMPKLVVYLHSCEVSSLGFVDKEGAQHACAQAWAAFQGLESVSSILGNRYLYDEDLAMLVCVEEFCRYHGLEYEVVDLGAKSFIRRAVMRLQGIKTPGVCCGDKTFYGVPDSGNLEELILPKTHKRAAEP